MACCGGGSSAGNLEQSALLIDQAAEAGAVTRLVYTCESRQTQAFTLSGRVFQFGNNDRRRVNAVDSQKHHPATQCWQPQNHAP